MREPQEERRLRLEDIHEGDTLSRRMCLDEEKLQAFIALAEDTALAHVDDGHARRMGFKGRIAHGLLVAAGYSGLLGMFLPGPNTVIHQLRLDMKAPAYVGDTLTYTVTAERVVVAVKTVILRLSAVNQDGTVVSSGSATCVFCL